MKLAGIFLAAATSFAQTATFEAASIKPADSSRAGHGINVEGARIRMKNVPLKFCVQIAWSVQDFQVSGGPAWADKDTFDIDAVAAKPFEGQEYRTMLQALLAERFGVTVHREMQDKQGYALVVAKNGPKLSPGSAEASMMFSRTPTGDRLFEAKGATMSELARALSSELRQIVVDRTGLKQTFDGTLQWTPDGPVVSKNGQPLPPPPPDAIPGPSIFTAIQDKLGLKLESRKVPVEVIVIDRAERPSAN